MFLSSVYSSEVKISSSSEVSQLDGNLSVLRHVYSPPDTVGGSLPSLTPFAFGLCLSLIRGLEIKHLKVSVASQITPKRSL